MIGFDYASRRQVAKIGWIHKGHFVQIEVSTETIISKLEGVAVDELYSRTRSIQFVRVRRWRKLGTGREHPDSLGDIAFWRRLYHLSRHGSPSLISGAGIVKNGVTRDCNVCPVMGVIVVMYL